MSFDPDSKEHEGTLLGLLARQNSLLEQIVLQTSTDSPTPVRLVSNGSQQVQANEAGELVVAIGPYDLVMFNELAVAATAYNFFKPKGREQFVITGFLMYADNQVGVNNATVVVYEASAPDSVTEDKVLVQVEIGQNQSIPFPSIRILCNKGKYINAKTDDDDVHMTMFGHYVDLQGKGETS